MAAWIDFWLDGWGGTVTDVSDVESGTLDDSTVAIVVPRTGSDDGYFGYGAASFVSNITYSIGAFTTTWAQAVAITGGGLLDRVIVPLSTSGSPTDGVFVDITDGSPSGAVVGTSATVAASSLTSSMAEVPLYFSTPLALVPGNTYYLRMWRTGAVDSVNLVHWHVAKLQGTKAQYDSGTSTWSIPSSTTSPPGFKIDEAASLTANSTGTDSGVLGESPSLALSATDSRTGVDSGTAIALSASDVGTASEATALGLSGSDPFTGLDQAGSIALAASDAATLSESPSLGVSSTEAGTCVESPAIALASSEAGSTTATYVIALASSESASSTETTSLALSASDSCTGVDAGAAIALANSDVGTATETSTVSLLKSSSDTGQVADSVSLVELAAADSATLAETSVIALSASDVGTDVDTARIALAVNDAASLSETSSVAIVLSASDPRTCTETVALALAATDFFTFLDGPPEVVKLSATDAGTSTQTTTVVASLTGAESATVHIGNPLIGADSSVLWGNSPADLGQGLPVVIATECEIDGLYTTLARLGSPTDNVVFDVATSVDGPALASASIAGSSLGTTRATVFAPFSAPVTLPAGMVYFRVRRDGPPDAVNRYDSFTTNRVLPAGRLSYTGSAWFDVLFTTAAVAIWADETARVSVVKTGSDSGWETAVGRRTTEESFANLMGSSETAFSMPFVIERDTFVDGVWLPLMVLGSPTDSLDFSICRDDGPGGGPGTGIYTGLAHTPGSSLTSSLDWRYSRFAIRVPLSPGTYYLVGERSGAPSFPNTFGWGQSDYAAQAWSLFSGVWTQGSPGSSGLAFALEEAYTSVVAQVSVSDSESGSETGLVAVVKSDGDVATYVEDASLVATLVETDPAAVDEEVAGAVAVAALDSATVGELEDAHPANFISDLDSFAGAEAETYSELYSSLDAAVLSTSTTIDITEIRLVTDAVVVTESATVIATVSSLEVGFATEHPPAPSETEFGRWTNGILDERGVLVFVRDGRFLLADGHFVEVGPKAIVITPEILHLQLVKLRSKVVKPVLRLRTFKPHI